MDAGFILALVVILASTSSSFVDARGYISMKSGKSKTADDTENEVRKPLDENENSVEKSPLLQVDPDQDEKELSDLDPLMSNIADLDVNTQILVQLRDVTEQLIGLRKSVANLKYQSHLQYKMVKRMQNSCETGRNDGMQHNMIRTAALKMDSDDENSIMSDHPMGGAGPLPLMAPQCPDGFEYNPETRSCYLFDSTRTTWRNARERCLVMGADLVTIETSREQRYITETSRARSDIRHCDFWTGLTDQNSEGQWYWVANKKPLSYSYWNHNEPNNGNGDEHCMHMLWVFGWSWNDARCNVDRACYICEIHKRGKGRD